MFKLAITQNCRPALVLILVCLIFQGFIFAQPASICGWDQIYGAKGRLHSTLDKLSPLVPSPALLNLDDAPVVTLPVVVHIIHTGGGIGTAYNPTNAQVNAMIAMLNKAWRKSTDAFGGVDMRIQFALATKGPDCEATLPIIRIDASAIPDYASGGIAIDTFTGSAPERSVKALSRWPNTDYINIWIVNKINGSESSPGGFAYFPEYNSAKDDGITLLAGTVDGVNQTIVHEMGHYFYLFHTFADGGWENTCAANANCSEQGDRVCDTEHCKKVPCGTPNNECTNQPFTIADEEKGFTVLNNHMGYGNCAAMFSAGQRERVHDALARFRHSLLSSSAFHPELNNVPQMACIPNAVNGLSKYYGVQKVQVNAYSVYSNTSEADGGTYMDRTCNQRFTVNKGGKVWVEITAGYLNWSAVKVFVDANNNGHFSDAGEELMFKYGGMVSDSVILPATALLNTPLRLRVVADHWQEPAPTACQLTGTPVEKAGQAEDYTLIIQRRKVISLKSGNWNDPASWDCGCIPGAEDEVTIKANQTITFTNSMGLGRCFSMHIQSNAHFIHGGNFRVGL